MTRQTKAEKTAETAMIAQDPAALDDMPKEDLIDMKAAKEWRRVVPELKRSGIVGQLDIANIIGYCNAYSIYCAATNELKGQELVIEGVTGRRENPLINVQLKAAQDMRRFADLCGLTINSRLKWAATQRKKQEEQIESEFGAI